MNEKTYIIDLSGEDGATTTISVTPDVYEKLKSAFDELNSSCKYVSVTITEPEPTRRVYYIKVSRTGRPINGSRTIISGCDIPLSQDVYTVLNVAPNNVVLFDTSEAARAYIKSFNKNK